MKQTHNQSANEHKTKPTGLYDWRDEFKAFHQRHGRKAFTPMFNSTLEAEMFDADLPKELRVLAAIRRYAWGNLADFAVTEKPKRRPNDPAPKPMSQERLGDILGLQKSHMSETIAFLKAQKYIRPNHQYLYPEELVSPIESTKDARSRVPTPRNFHSPSILSPWVLEQLGKKAPELLETLTRLVGERNTVQETAKKLTIEIREIKYKALAIWRDQQRESDEDLDDTAA